MRFLTAWLLVFIGLLLQFSIVYHGIYFDLAFAALIAVALRLSFSEVLCLSLFAGFMLNWQAGLSIPIAVIVVYPLVIVLLQKLLHWEGWFGLLISLMAGLLLLSFAEYPGFLYGEAAAFFFDLVISMGFGALSFFAVGR